VSSLCKRSKFYGDILRNIIRKMSSYNVPTHPIIEALWEGMDWIDLAQDRDKWRPLLNAVMNLRVP